MENIDFAKHMLRLLRDALKSDPAAINSLVSQRVYCNEVLAKHQYFQVLLTQDGSGNNVYILGILGIINGVLDSLNAPVISAIMNEKNGIVDFALYDMNKKEVVKE